jgi:hypothetical protein
MELPSSVGWALIRSIFRQVWYKGDTPLQNSHGSILRMQIWMLSFKRMCVRRTGKMKTSW